MRGKGVCEDYPGRRTCSGSSTVKSSQGKGNLDNVVIIDVDSDGLDNVIVIDVPETLQRKLRGSSMLREGGKFPFQGIVYIDDDVEDDDVDPLGNSAEGDCDVDNDGTGSESNPAGDHAERFGDGDDDCQVVNKKCHPFKLSKCKRTCAEKTTSRNHYGLYSESESDSSQSDSSDCEVMEGSSGEFRENWEKAFLKRRSARKSRLGQEDQAVPCSSHDTNAEVEDKAERSTEPPVSSSPHNTNFDKNCSGVFTGTQNGVASGGFFNAGMETSSTTSHHKVDGARFSRWCKRSVLRNMNSSRKADDRGETSVGNPNDTYDECQNMNDFGTTSAQNKTSCPRGSSWLNHEECDKHCYQTRSFSQDGEQNSPGEKSEFEKWGVHSEGVPLFRDRQSTETHNFNQREVFPGKEGKTSSASSSSPNICSNGVKDKCSGVQDKKKQFHGQNFSFKQSEETVIGNVVGLSEHKGKVVLEESFVDAHEKPGYRDKDEADAQGRSSCITQFDETASRMGTTLAEQKEPFAGSKSNLNLSDDRNPSSTTVDDPKTAFQGNIINDREKLKETDEYRRAMEEEWATRQRQLQIQAEEAQRQRRKRKAESLRVLEMEKRQKQRLEEVRESQKKVEENLNMKERLRSEVRKEICKLEVMCNDMASLLRGLGIQVVGGSLPSSHEVHAAYKRALLKFHPDRASRLDIQQQVEAEEKFKLISRMREKFLSTACQ